MTSNPKTPIVLLALVLVMSVLPGAVADHDGDALPDAQEKAVCDDPTLGHVLLQGLGVCQGDDDIVVGVPPVGSPGDDDGDLVPDPVEEILCASEAVPEETCNRNDFDLYAFPMEILLGPVCDAAGDDAPAEVCVFRHLPLGVTLCAVRAKAPAGGAVLVCEQGAVSPTCSEETNLADILNQFVGDMDCDGHGNGFELEQGCDPTDSQSYPTAPGECSESGGPGGDLLGGCSGTDDPVEGISEMFGDLDCDGHSNLQEIGAGCNPADATEFPGAPDGCTL